MIIIIAMKEKEERRRTHGEQTSATQQHTKCKHRRACSIYQLTQGSEESTRAKAKEEEQRRKANLTEWPGSVMILGAAGQNARSSSCPLVPYSIYRFFMYHNNAQYACLHTCPPPHAQYSLFSNYFIAGVRTRIIYRFATARQALCLVTPIIAPNPLMVFGLPRLPRSTYTGEPSGEIRGNKRLANHNRWRKDQTGNSKTVMTSKRACFRSIRV